MIFETLHLVTVNAVVNCDIVANLIVKAAVCLLFNNYFETS